VTPREARAVADAIEMLNRGHTNAALLLLRRLQTEQFESMCSQGEPDENR
jgi:hypothetical protein